MEGEARATAAVLGGLWATVEARRGADPRSSYSASLLARHPVKPAQKLAEEAAECAIEAVAGRPDNLVRESADLLYHLVVLLVGADVRAGDLLDVLVAREQSSGRRAKRGTTKIP